MYKCIDCGMIPSDQDKAHLGYKCNRCGGENIDESRQWSVANDDKPPCAWCFGTGTQGNSFGSHGICQQHANEQIAAMTRDTEDWPECNECGSELCHHII